MEVFYDATVSLSGVYNPISPLVLHNIVKIINMFLLNTNESLFEPIV